MLDLKATANRAVKTTEAPSGSYLATYWDEVQWMQTKDGVLLYWDEDREAFGEVQDPPKITSLRAFRRYCVKQIEDALWAEYLAQPDAFDVMPAQFESWSHDE